MAAVEEESSVTPPPPSPPLPVRVAKSSLDNNLDLCANLFYVLILDIWEPHCSVTFSSKFTPFVCSSPM